MMSILGSIGEFIGGIFNVIWACLCVPIYFNIARFFNLFITIAELDILSDANMNEIYKRVTMIITIIMSFYVVFSIVKYTISPDTVGDKEKGAGKIVYRMIIVILLIAFVPEMFSMAYKIQNRLISTQVFSKVILGHEAIDYTTYGNSFAADTFSAFYRVDYKNCGNSCDAAQEHVSDVIEGIRSGTGGTLNIISAIGGQIGWSVSGHIVDAETVEFDGLLALIFGGFALYVLFLYCIDVAVRYVQMLYLQIIAPIAITGYVVPSKDNMFQKWWKQCLTTYLDLFIRISIMYFAMLIIQILGHSLNITQMTSNGNNLHFQFPIFNDGTGALRVYIFFVMGVLIFMQRAPKLISELFPKGGAAGIGFGLEWKTRGEPLKKSIDTVKKPIAATAGAIASTASTFKSLRSGNLKKALNGKYGEEKSTRKSLRSALILGKSAFSGGKDGAKNGSIRGAINNREKGIREAINLMDAGGDVFEHTFRGGRAATEKDKYKSFMDALKAMADTKKTVDGAADDEKLNKAAVAFLADLNERGIGSPLRRDDFKKDIKKLTHIYAASGHTAADKAAAEAAITAAFTKLGLSAAEASQVNLSQIEADFKVRFGKDAESTEMNIHTQEIAHAQAVALSTRNKDGDIHHIVLDTDDARAEIFERRDSEGNVICQARDFTGWAQWVDSLPNNVIVDDGHGGTTTKEKEQAKIRKFFAAHLGDFEKYASDKTVETQYSDAYKAANANANVPGKKDGDK